MLARYVVISSLVNTKGYLFCDTQTGEEHRVEYNEFWRAYAPQSNVKEWRAREDAYAADRAAPATSKLAQPMRTAFRGMSLSFH